MITFIAGYAVGSVVTTLVLYAGYMHRKYWDAIENEKIKRGIK